MDILKAANLFQKLAQQQVNLQPQQVSAVSKNDINNIVNSVMYSLGKRDPNLGWKSEAVLLPDDSYKLMVIVNSQNLDDLLVKQQVEEALYTRWPNTPFNVEVYMQG